MEATCQVSLDAITQNFTYFQKRTDPAQIIPVVKANAYGHGALAITKHLHSTRGVKTFAVATLEEAHELAAEFNDISILIFSRVFASELAAVPENAILSVGSIEDACETPESLEAIAGAEGTVFFTSWSDSLEGAVVVVFDKSLDFDRIDEPGYKVIDYFITYGDPINPGTSRIDYFIQLEAGEYQLMVIGLLLDPAQLLANAELFQEIQNYIVVPENSAPRGIVIREKQINEQTDWYVQF